MEERKKAKEKQMAEEQAQRKQKEIEEQKRTTQAEIAKANAIRQQQEQEKQAKLKAEQENQAKLKAEQDRIAKAKLKAEQENQAKLKTEQNGTKTIQDIIVKANAKKQQEPERQIKLNAERDTLVVKSLKVESASINGSKSENNIKNISSSIKSTKFSQSSFSAIDNSRNNALASKNEVAKLEIKHNQEDKYGKETVDILSNLPLIIEKAIAGYFDGSKFELKDGNIKVLPGDDAGQFRNNA